MLYLLVITLIASAIIGYIVSRMSRILALRYQLTDNPLSHPDRKSQKQPVPLFGGLGFFVVVIVALTGLWLEVKFNWFGYSEFLHQGFFYPFKLIYILIGGLIIYLAGCLDDAFELSPKIYFPMIFVGLLIAIVVGGVKIENFAYPFDKLAITDWLQYFLAFGWVGICLVATKFLDGLDGLVTSVGIINLLTIAGVALSLSVNQPFIALVSIAGAGALIGFLPSNFPSARQYLGEGGSTIIGYFIGIFSLLAGAKVATIGITLGWFVLDILLVMFFRFLQSGSIGSILKGDRTHWHHRLLDYGFSKIQVLAITAWLIITSSQIALNVPTAYKIWVLLGQYLVFCGLFLATYRGKVRK